MTKEKLEEINGIKKEIDSLDTMIKNIDKFFHDTQYNTNIQINILCQDTYGNERGKIYIDARNHETHNHLDEYLNSLKDHYTSELIKLKYQFDNL